MLDILNSYIGKLAVIGGAIAACAVFMQNLFTIRKLKLEVSKLKKEQEQQERKIYLPTPQEVAVFQKKKLIKDMSKHLELHSPMHPEEVARRRLIYTFFVSLVAIGLLLYFRYSEVALYILPILALFIGTLFLKLRKFHFKRELRSEQIWLDELREMIDPKVDSQ